MHFKFVHANQIAKLTALLTVKVNLFIAFTVPVFEFIWPCNKMEGVLSSDSSKSVYCKLFVGKMLSILLLLLLLLFNSCCVWSLIVFLKCSCVQAFQYRKEMQRNRKEVKNKNVRMQTLSHFCSIFCFFFFCSYKSVTLSSYVLFWHTLSTCT